MHIYAFYRALTFNGPIFKWHATKNGSKKITGRGKALSVEESITFTEASVP